MQHINLHNALVVAPISMAKISGEQSAERTVSLFTETLLPYAPKNEDSTDISVITTEGLYLNDSGQSAFHLREKLWQKADSFRVRFRKRIADAQKKCPRILPSAYEIVTFDALRYSHYVYFRQLLGFLKNEAHTNTEYREKLANDLDQMGQPEREDKINFLNEEYVWDWLVYNGQLTRQNGSLRRHNNGQIVICYPEALLESKVEAYRLLTHATSALPFHTCIYVDTKAGKDEDIAATVRALDLQHPLRRKISSISSPVKMAHPV